MFERFTKQARKVIASSNTQANRLGHEYIGTEHILLAMTEEGGDICNVIFKEAGINKKKIEKEVKKLVKVDPDNVSYGKLPQTPRAKNVIRYAIDEATELDHKRICTQHILLGLLCEYDGVAYEVLTKFGLELEQVRKKVLNLLSTSPGK